MDAVERLAAHESLERLDAKPELSNRRGPSMNQPAFAAA